MRQPKSAEIRADHSSRPERPNIRADADADADRELVDADSRGCIVASVDNFTPFERHRLDRSHYGEICSRCGYLRCDLCAVECHCNAEVRSLTRWVQKATQDAANQENHPKRGTTQVRLNAGRTSLTVVATAPDGTVKMFRLTVEAI